MSTFGIVCEFNPLHNGHKRLIDEAKRLGAERVVCVMSGNAVQRGELAITDKYTRAKAAVLCGADLVLELPYPWCAASAEYFSACGVEVLSYFCDSVIFGSECGDIELLKKAGSVAAKEEFKNSFIARTEQGEGAASAYFSLLEEETGVKLSSNDLLGMEYIRTAIEKKLDIKFYTLKREGAGYNDELLSVGQYPSATAIRRAWREGRDAFAYMPTEAAEVFLNSERSAPEELSKAMLMYFRLADPKDFEDVAEAEGGIANRIINASKEARNGEEFFELLRTKRYTDAKLRRAILFCMTGVTQGLLKQRPAYVTLLGASDKGRELIAKARKSDTINIVTKPADAPKDTEQFETGEKLEAIFTLSLKNSASLGESYRKNAFIK